MVMMDTELFKPIPEGDWEFREGPMVEGWDPYNVLPTLADKAVEYIQNQQADQPFFLYFPLPSPHAPIIPNDEFRGKSGAGAYGDFVVEIDYHIGRILTALDEAGLAENTLVIFTADNGPESYAYSREEQTGHWSSGKWRGVKRDLWEGGHRVPFVVRWPGRVQPGQVSDETVSQVDLAATFAEILGRELAPSEAIDSYSLVSLLRGKAGDGPLRTATVQNTYDRYVLRQGDWLFINASSGEHTSSSDAFNAARGYTNEVTAGLLYNLKDDPAQQVNLYSQYPERVVEMRALLTRYIEGEPCAPHAKQEWIDDTE